MIRIATRILLLLLACAPLLHAAADDTVARADQLLAHAQYAEACKLYEQAIAEGAQLESDLLRSRNLARCYLNQSPPRLNQAVQWLQNGVRLDPAAEDVRDFLAQTLMRANNFGAAAGQYLILADAHPDTADYVLGLAGALRQAGRSAEALRALKVALERSPNLTSVRLEYAQTLVRQQQFQSAKEQYRLLLAADPGNIAARLGLATIASWQGDQESALELYNQLLQQRPALYEALAGKALSLLWLGRKQDALPLLVAALKRHPDDRDVRNALRDLGVNPDDPVTLTDHRSAQAQKPGKAPQAALHAPLPLPQPHVSQPVGPTATSSSSVAKETGITWWSVPRVTTVGIVMALVLLLWLFRGIIARRKSSDTKTEILSLRLASLRLAEANPVVMPSGEPATRGIWPDQHVDHGEATELPIAKPFHWMDEVVAEVTTSQPEPAASPVPAVDGLRVFVVGGQPNLREVEVRALQSAGLSVESVDNFPQGLLRWLAHPEAIVLINEEEGSAWNIARVHNWLFENRPDWIRRAVFVVSNPDDFGFSKSSTILRLPFGSHELLRCLSKFSHDSHSQAKAAGL